MFHRDIFRALIQEIAEAREVEIGCDECFEELDRFVEMRLSGLEAARTTPLVQEHLEIFPRKLGSGETLRRRVLELRRQCDARR
jgi:hypothetical protein